MITSKKPSESPIRLDLTSNFSPEDIAKLIGSVRDDQSWTLVITYRGEIYFCLSDDVWDRMPPELHPDPRGIEVGDPKLFREMDEEVERDKTLFAQKSNSVWFRFESFCEGNGYVGPEAARDRSFVSRIHSELKRIAENWEDYGQHGCYDTYIDEF